MGFQVSPLEERDIPAYTRVELEAFKSHPRTPMLWTHGYTSAVYAYNEAGKRRGLDDPHEHALKCIDLESGQLVAGATYTFAFKEENGQILAADPPEPVKDDEPPPPNWPAGGNWSMRRFYTINTPKVVQAHVGEQPYIILDYLTVLPRYQGRGIGQRLLQWGVEQADQRNLVMCLESTPVGRRLYERFGFHEKTVIKADMHDFGWTDTYDDDDAARIFMVREPCSRKPLLDWSSPF